MPTFNIDTAAAVGRLERVGFPAEQAREIVDILAEADAEHVTKADVRTLEQQMRVLEQKIQTGFAKIATTLAEGQAEQAKANQRLSVITLAGVAVATAIVVAVLA